MNIIKQNRIEQRIKSIRGGEDMKWHDMTRVTSCEKRRKKSNIKQLTLIHCSDQSSTVYDKLTLVHAFTSIIVIE